MTTATTSSAPFAKDDRVIIREDAPSLKGAWAGVHGRVARRPIFKSHPKGGKTPGWWLFVVLDPEPGIKRWTVEVHANCVRAEGAEERSDLQTGNQNR